MNLPLCTEQLGVVGVTLIETAPREFNANFNSNGGPQPYFVLDRAVKGGDGARNSTFEFRGYR